MELLQFTPLRKGRFQTVNEVAQCFHGGSGCLGGFLLQNVKTLAHDVL
jgi:hypothetical protein